MSPSTLHEDAKTIIARLIEVWAMERSPERVPALEATVARLGTHSVHVVQGDGRSYAFPMPFDRVLVDAPCSGTGTLARNPEIKWRLEQGDLARLAALQAAMLQNALEVLAPGGRLVYVTCSLEPEENERVVEKVLAEEQAVRLVGRDTLAREFPDFAPLFGPDGFFRTRPDLDSMDGFFAAVIVREALG